MAPLVFVILAITIILIPVSLLAAAALALAWLFGMIAIGSEVGERFTHAINQTWAPPLTVGIGDLPDYVGGRGIGMIPCIGWLATSLVALLGIGGVVLTLFGTQQHGLQVVLYLVLSRSGRTCGPLDFHALQVGLKQIEAGGTLGRDRQRGNCRL